MPAADERQFRHPLGRLAALAATIGLLAGCGTAAPPHRTAPTATPTPAQSNADAGGTSVPARHASRPSRSAVHRSPSSPALVSRPATGASRGGVQRATATPGQSGDDLQRSTVTKFNPCSLVSASEAQAITGVALTGRVEAPLGPTCVYKLGGSKGDITLAVEALSLSQVAHQMVKPQTLIVGHRHAYCGRLGTQMLFAPVGRGKLLNVTAPCAIARRFAALALTRLTA